MDQQENNDDFKNPMVAHYNNPELNAFNDEEDLTIKSMKENARLWIGFPTGLKKHAIHNIMKQFGHVDKIDGPYDTSSSTSRTFAFVEFKTFKEAEMALRELNSSKNTGLEIKAEFAHLKSDKNSKACKNINQEQSILQEKPIKKIDVPESSVSINFKQLDVEDSFEKLSFFKYKGPNIADMEEGQMKYIASCAEKSLGEYDEEQECFAYNIKLRESHFLTFYCCVCDNEATIKSKEYQRYFCTKDCADVFMKRKDTKAKQYVVTKSDKVCITAVISEKCIYVRPAHEDLDFILEKVFRKTKQFQPIEMVPEINEKVFFAVSDNIYRAEVLQIHEDETYDFPESISLTLRLLDIGNTLCAHFYSIFEMTPEALEIESITTNVMLKNVNVEAINMDVIEYLMELKDNNVELVVKESDENGVELKESTTNVLVNKKINELANFDKIKFNETIEMDAVNDLIVAKDYTHKLFVVNILDTEGFKRCVCIAEKYVPDFHELYRSLNAYAKKIDQEKYGIYGHKIACLAKYNEQWHRASIIDAIGDGKPQCLLIDLCLICKIKVENIFQLPESIARFPIMSEIYEINGYATDPDIKKYCDENVSANAFIIASKVEVKDEVPIIHIDMTKKQQ